MTEPLGPQYRTLVESVYKDAFFRAMLQYQHIEHWLKSCIQCAYDKFNNEHSEADIISLQAGDVLRPENQANLTRKTLKPLLDIFVRIMPYPSLVKSIERRRDKRNKIAHAEAANFDFKLIFTGHKELRFRHKEADELLGLANELEDYALQLIDIYQELLEK